MSHYTVAVIHKKNQNIEDLLAPYDEAAAGSDFDKAKWDWYEIGGRWEKMIRTAKGNTNEAHLGDIITTIDEADYERALDFWDCEVDGTKERTPGRDYFTLYKPEYYKEFYGDRETFARIQATLRTYAVITPDGEWHAEGNMGWFGCSSATPKEFREWSENWQKNFIENQDPELIMTIVDCHI